MKEYFPDGAFKLIIHRNEFQLYKSLLKFFKYNREGKSS